MAASRGNDHVSPGTALAGGRRATGSPTPAAPSPGWQRLAFRAAPFGIQTKLEVGAPEDAYEREADRIAEAVTRGGEAGPVSGVEGVRVQRFATEDCADPDMARIRESYDRSIELLRNAIQRLTANPVSATTQTHFANHFGAWSEWRRDHVVDSFYRDLNLMLGGDITYECESECDQGDAAYTYWIFGDIHICLPWLHRQVLNERAETLIHELHHWDVQRGHLDLGYHKNNQDAGTNWVVATLNADAFSELAQDLFEQP